MILVSFSNMPRIVKNRLLRNQVDFHTVNCISLGLNVQAKFILHEATHSNEYNHLYMHTKVIFFY